MTTWRKSSALIRECNKVQNISEAAGNSGFLITRHKPYKPAHCSSGGRCSVFEPEGDVTFSPLSFSVPEWLPIPLRIQCRKAVWELKIVASTQIPSSLRCDTPLTRKSPAKPHQFLTQNS